VALCEDARSCDSIEAIVVLGWEGIGLAEEELLKIRVGLLLLCFLEQAPAGIDSYNLSEASLLEVLPYEACAAAHVKDLLLSGGIPEELLGELRALEGSW
jgi:hypothetical protein